MGVNQRRASRIGQVGEVNPNLAVRLERVLGDADDEAGLPAWFTGEEAIIRRVNGADTRLGAAEDIDTLVGVE